MAKCDQKHADKSTSNQAIIIRMLLPFMLLQAFSLLEVANLIKTAVYFVLFALLEEQVYTFVYNFILIIYQQYQCRQLFSNLFVHSVVVNLIPFLFVSYGEVLVIVFVIYDVNEKIGVTLMLVLMCSCNTVVIALAALVAFFVIRYNRRKEEENYDN